MAFLIDGSTDGVGLESVSEVDIEKLIFSRANGSEIVWGQIPGQKKLGHVPMGAVFPTHIFVTTTPAMPINVLLNQHPYR